LCVTRHFYGDSCCIIRLNYFRPGEQARQSEACGFRADFLGTADKYRSYHSELAGLSDGCQSNIVIGDDDAKPQGMLRLRTMAKLGKSGYRLLRIRGNRMHT
jgi:hypothetical protein